MENIEKETGQIGEISKVKGDEIKSQTVRVPKNYFMYGKLRPYLNKYWYNGTDNDSIICSSEFFVFSIKDSFNRLYFQYVLSSSIIQKQIANITSGVRMPRINESFFKDLQIPLPPPEIQTQIVNHITTQKEQIKNLRQQAEKLRKQAKENFEKEIFVTT
jgi:type I restriction enzyme, S subunit